MRMVEYRPLRDRIVAEWLHCAGLTCGEYMLGEIGEKIEAIVLAELRGQAKNPWHGVLELTKEEED